MDDENKEDFVYQEGNVSELKLRSLIIVNLDASVVYKPAQPDKSGLPKCFDWVG